jgi:SpoVK/Ycf46/Vps4 family AAA+-type ATPase
MDKNYKQPNNNKKQNKKFKRYANTHNSTNLNNINNTTNLNDINNTTNSTNGIVLVPQYNKYISIFNNNTPKAGLLANNQRELQPNPTMTSIPKITKIVVKRPNNADNDNIESINDDNIISNLISNILSGNSSLPIEHNYNFKSSILNKSQILNPNQNTNKTIEEIIIPKIDYDNMIFLDEKPKNIDDLLIIIHNIGNKYSLDKYYNLDIIRLNNIKNPLIKLSKMIGLDEVKSRIVDIILYYLQRLDIKNYDLLHTIIDGAPGTGKTEIAHIYSEILVGLGILSKNTFKTAKKNDFIGGYLGHTAMKTMKLLEEVKGGVLFIDEIYSFGNGDGKDGKDIYAKEFVDLLMQYMSENKGDFVLVVAGYKNDIKRFFLSMNDGLERRFPIHLSIGEYSPLEMYKIFLKKVEELKWSLINENDDDTAFYIKFFEDNKEYFKFFGGDMEVLLTKCKYAHSRNLLEDHSKKHRIITINDFNNGFVLFKQNPEIEERKLSGKYLSYFI